MTILDVIEGRLIPWIETRGLHRLVVAGDAAGERPLPEGMRVTRTKLKGRRVAVRGPRTHGHASNTVAVWPLAGMTEVRLPFLVCVIGSRVAYPAGERTFHCSAGDILLVPSRTPHPGPPVSEEGGPFEVLDVLSISTWDNHRQCCVCYGGGGNYLIPNPTAVLLLDTLMDELARPRRGSAKVGVHLFLTLLNLILREFHSRNYFRAGVSLFDTGGADARIDPIQRVRHYVANHLNEPLTIDDASNRALMSRTQFTRRFREATGQSFLEYVTHCRMEQARVLLHETEWSLALISEFVGFRDTTQLHRMFSRHAGMSPVRYRQTSRAIKEK